MIKNVQKNSDALLCSGEQGVVFSVQMSGVYVVNHVQSSDVSLFGDLVPCGVSSTKFRCFIVFR